MTSRTLTLVVVLGLAVVLGPAGAAEFSDVTGSLARDIQTSQKNLSAAEKRIAGETAGLYKKLQTRQNQVAKLRKQAGVARRKLDEQTLGLEQLQLRLKKWREQNRYQKHLLASFAEKISAPPAQIGRIGQDMNVGLTLVDQALKDKGGQLAPRWNSAKIISPQGIVEAAEVIHLGPVSWFWQSQQHLGGLANPSGDGFYQVVQAFERRPLRQLEAVYAEQQGSLYFDPTLDRALKIANSDETLIQHLEKGGIWVIPILFFALLSLGIAVFKAIQLWRLPGQEPLLAERIASLAHGQGDPAEPLRQLRENLQGVQADLVSIIAETPVSSYRDERLFACLLENQHKLQRMLGVIAVTAVVAPLLGLLGTVSGMIETFKLITLFGAGDPMAVSGGISEALVTTEMGLVVAIPALILHALLSRHIRTYNTHLEATAIKLGPLELSGSSA